MKNTHDLNNLQDRLAWLYKTKSMQFTFSDLPSNRDWNKIQEKEQYFFFNPIISGVIDLEL